MTFGGFSLSAGQENTLCVTKRLGNTAAFHAGTIHSQLSGGWREVVAYRVNDSTESLTPTPCSPFSGLGDGTATPVFFGHSTDERIELPLAYGVPFDANQMLRIEFHGRNDLANTQSFDATFTFTASHSSSPSPAGLLLTTLPDISLPMAQPTSISGTVRLPADVTGGQLLNFTGFTHGLGTDFSTSVGASIVYAPTPYLWDSPSIGTGAPVAITPDGGVTISCTWNSTTGSSVGFGTASTDEICLLRTWVAPASARTICLRTAQFGGLDVCCPGHAACAQIF